MVSCCVFFSDTLRDSLMDIYEDVDVEGKYIIVFSFDEWDKIKIEAQRTQRLITGIVLDILTWGIENYPHTKKKYCIG